MWFALVHDAALPEGVLPPIPTYELGPAPGVSAYSNNDPFNPTLRSRDTATDLAQMRTDELTNGQGFQASPGVLTDAPGPYGFIEQQSAVGSATGRRQAVTSRAESRPAVRLRRKVLQRADRR